MASSWFHGHRFLGFCYVLVTTCGRWGEKRDLTSLFCCWDCMAGSEPACSDEYSLNECLLKCQVPCSARCLTSHVSFNLPQTRKPGLPFNRWRDGCLEELSYCGQGQAPCVQQSWNSSLHLCSLSTSAFCVCSILTIWGGRCSIVYLLQWARLFFFFSSCDAQTWLPWGKWDLSSLTRDRTLIPWLAGRFLTIGPPGKSLYYYILYQNIVWVSVNTLHAAK